MNGICRLCMQEGDLMHSHILPEFMYQNLYDPNPKRFYTLNVNIEEMKNSTMRIQQKGIREYLLCGKCEELFSKYENYAAETIYGKNKKNTGYIVKTSKTQHEEYFIYEYAGLSYQTFKIFQMSILWRVIISTSFNTPDIDPQYVEKLRLSLLNEDPLVYDIFGCALQVIRYNKNQIANGFILDPFLTKNGNTSVLNILIDGFMYSYYLNSNHLSEEQKMFFLKEDGKVIIISRSVMNDIGLFETIRRAFQYFGTKNKNIFLRN